MGTFLNVTASQYFTVFVGCRALGSKYSNSPNSEKESVSTATHDAQGRGFLSTGTLQVLQLFHGPQLTLCTKCTELLGQHLTEQI